MIHFFSNKQDAAQFADDMQTSFGFDCQLTTITEAMRYVVSYAPSATVTLSEGTSIPNFSDTQVNI